MTRPYVLGTYLGKTLSGYVHRAQHIPGETYIPAGVLFTNYHTYVDEALIPALENSTYSKYPGETLLTR